MTRALLLVVIYTLFVASATAQSTEYGDCELGIAAVDLESADVRARLYNTGGLFWRGGAAEYEVPRGSGLTSIFAASILMGGFVDGQLRYAGADYSNWEFYPGPIPEDGSPPTAAYCANHDRLYRVTIDDIAHFNATGETTPDLADWPFELGAPVVDDDGDPTNYNLEAGDRPAILGGETVWWVMNDRGNEHEWGLTDPVGVDVRVTAFTFPRGYFEDRFNGFGNGFASEIALSTFYRYEITNRNDVPIDDFFVGLWLDTDLGDASDDYIGSDSLLHLSYTYNGDDQDGSSSGYGFQPPALGSTILEGMGGLDMHSSVTYWGTTHPILGNPANGVEGYNLLRGLWKNATPRTVGGDGFDHNNPMTRFMFSGEPWEFWSEGCLYPACGPNDSNNRGDRRFQSSTGPIQLAPGETAIVDVAIVWSRTETGGAIESVVKLKSDVSRLRSIYDGDVGLFEPDPRLATILPLGEPPEAPPTPTPETYALAAYAWPNPVTTEAVIRYNLPEAATIRLSVYDVRGREVAVLVEGAQETGFHEASIDASAWPNGVYLYRLDAGNRRKASGVFTVYR